MDNKGHIIIENIEKARDRNMHTVVYHYENLPDQSFNIVGKIIASDFTDESLKNIVLSTDINDLVGIEGDMDEKFVLFPDMLQPDPDTDDIPLGRLNYFIMYHCDSTQIPFSFVILKQDEEVDKEELQLAFYKFIGWW